MKEEADAGTTGVRSGGVFAGPLPSELADGPSKTPAPFAARKSNIVQRSRVEGWRRNRR